MLVLRDCGVVIGGCVARAQGLISAPVGAGRWFGSARAMRRADPSMPESATASRWLWTITSAGDMFATLRVIWSMVYPAKQPYADVVALHTLCECLSGS